MQLNIGIFILSILNLNGQHIPNQYIITFNELSVLDLNSKIGSINRLIFERANPFNKILHTYPNSINGISVRLDPSTLQMVQTLPDILSIEPDQIIQAFADQSNATWGLARVSQRDKLSGSTYTYHYDEKAGSNVNVYILDTGINVSHTDFQGRASWGTTTIDGASNEDKHGHGTHCAGTIAGKTHGVAKQAKVFAVKVLDDEGSGSDSSVIAGIDWVLKNKSGKSGNVISMSLGGGKSTALNKAIEKAVKAGVVTVVAAGNENQDACNVSPASAPSAITVGATDISDQKASFSNYGKCVDILAPGVKITSAWIGSNDATRTISGTSMACPHVAGVAATLLSQGTASKDIDSNLKSLGTKNKISGFNSQTPNVLAFNGFK